MLFLFVVYFPVSPENVTYVMNEVKCSGRESSLVECAHQGWGPMKCPGGTPVTLICRRSKMLQVSSLDLQNGKFEHRIYQLNSKQNINKHK